MSISDLVGVLTVKDLLRALAYDEEAATLAEYAIMAAAIAGAAFAAAAGLAPIVVARLEAAVAGFQGPGAPSQ